MSGNRTRGDRKAIAAFLAETGRKNESATVLSASTPANGSNWNLKLANRVNNKLSTLEGASNYTIVSNQQVRDGYVAQLNRLSNLLDKRTLKTNELSNLVGIFKLILRHLILMNNNSDKFEGTDRVIVQAIQYNLHKAMLGEVNAGIRRSKTQSTKVDDR